MAGTKTKMSLELNDGDTTLAFAFKSKNAHILFLSSDERKEDLSALGDFKGYEEELDLAYLGTRAKGRWRLIDKDELYGFEGDGIVFDASSFHPDISKGGGRREKLGDVALFWDKVEKIEKKISSLGIRSVCIYNLSHLNNGKVTELVKQHDASFLKSGDMYLATSPQIEPDELSVETSKEFIKNHLELVVLSLLKEKKMSGKDIIEWIHEKFELFLSSGRIYPLLQELEEEGLIRGKKSVKSKYYHVPKKKKDKVQEIKKRKLANMTSLCSYLDDLSSGEDNP